jgi:EF-P beta-lysylation protein EpmB
METSWQSELQQAVTDLPELCRLLDLPESKNETDYPLLVPRSFVDRMEKGNPNDPLLLQVLPCREENVLVSGFSSDPLGEIAEAETSQILNKYAGRSLILASEHCGIHCRFCFRRHFPKLHRTDSDTMLESIRNDSSIEEVILSGGDPLMLGDSELDELLQKIEGIAHVRRIRIHTRLPIVLPSRLTTELAQILIRTKPVYLVLHVNHPNELNRDFSAHRELLTTPVLMSQTVLLRGINDDAAILEQLLTRLIDIRIIPYYLHQLDRVQGAAHFEVSPEAGCKLVSQIRRRLPGYAVPSYVREVNGKESKKLVKS